MWSWSVVFYYDYKGLLMRIHHGWFKPMMDDTHARQPARQHATASPTVSVPVHTIADNEITDSSVLVMLRHEYHCYSVVVTKEYPEQEMATTRASTNHDGILSCELLYTIPFALLGPNT